MAQHEVEIKKDPFNFRVEAVVIPTSFKDDPWITMKFLRRLEAIAFDTRQTHQSSTTGACLHDNVITADSSAAPAAPDAAVVRAATPTFMPAQPARFSGEGGGMAGEVAAMGNAAAEVAETAQHDATDGQTVRNPAVGPGPNPPHEKRAPSATSEIGGSFVAAVAGGVAQSLEIGRAHV